MAAIFANNIGHMLPFLAERGKVLEHRTNSHAEGERSLLTGNLQDPLTLESFAISWIILANHRCSER